VPTNSNRFPVLPEKPGLCNNNYIPECFYLNEIGQSEDAK